MLSATPPQKVTAKPGATVPVEIRIDLRDGYHVNSDKPSDPYLIPLRFTWTSGIAQAVEVKFPQPKMEKFSFSETPLSVFDGQFRTTTTFKIAAGAPAGPVKVVGKLRYQACNDRMCLPPRTVDVAVPFEIRP